MILFSCESMIDLNKQGIIINKANWHYRFVKPIDWGRLGIKRESLVNLKQINFISFRIKYQNRKFTIILISDCKIFSRIILLNILHFEPLALDFSWPLTFKWMQTDAINLKMISIIIFWLSVVGDGNSKIFCVRYHNVYEIHCASVDCVVFC